MNITPGKYLMRSNEVVTVEATEAGGTYPIRGGSEDYGFLSWTAAGHYTAINDKEHALDLVSRVGDEAPPLPSTDERPLTRRERFAMAAMQGFLANPDCSTSFEGFAKDAVAQADALIAELDKGAEQ